MLSLGEKMFILVTKNNYSLQQMYSPESNTSNTSQGLLLMCEKGTKNSPKQTTETVNMNFFIINHIGDFSRCRHHSLHIFFWSIKIIIKHEPLIEKKSSIICSRGINLNSCLFEVEDQKNS